MKKIIALLQILALTIPSFIPFTTLALTEPDKALITPRNLIPNPGFENGASGWTVSGGVTKAANTTAKGTGVNGYDWDSNASGQTMQTPAITIPPGYYGKVGYVSCQIKTVSGTATHTIGVTNGTSSLPGSSTVVTNTAGFATSYSNFIFPTSGTVAPILTSVASNEPELYIDDCYLGLAEGKNIDSSIPQPYLLDAVTVTGCSAVWTTAATSLSALAACTGATYTSAKGICTAPSTNIPGVKCSTLLAGDYALQAEGLFQESTAALTASYQFTDGVNAARELSGVSNGSNNTAVPGISQSISYLSSQTNTTLQIYARTDSGGGANIYGTTAHPLVIKVWYFPPSQTTVRANAMFDSTGLMTFTNLSACPGGTLLANGQTVTQAAYPHYFAAQGISGSTTTLPNMSALYPRGAGTQTVSSIAYSATLGATVGDTIQGHRHSFLSGGNALQLSGGSSVANFLGSGSASYTSSTTNDPVTNGTNGTPRTGNETAPVSYVGNWCMIMNGVIGMPVQSGSVVSSDPGVVRIERGGKAGCTTSPCTITINPGNWLSSITRSGVGVYTANFATAFSVAPVCTFSIPSGNDATVINVTATTTGVTYTNINTTGNTAEDGVPEIFTCIGTK